MEVYAALDVSDKTTRVCVVDGQGAIVDHEQWGAHQWERFHRGSRPER